MLRDELHDIVGGYLQEWFRDPCGTWWEADISHRLYARLAVAECTSDDRGVSFGPVSKPGFLGRWANPRTRRLSVVNHVKADGRGIYPDLGYRKESGEGYDWILEIKHWSPSGIQYDKGIEGFVDALKRDVETRRPRWGAWEHLLLLGLINLPLEMLYAGGAKPFNMTDCKSLIRRGLQDVVRMLQPCDDMVVAWKQLGSTSVEAFGGFSSSSRIEGAGFEAISG